MNVQTDFDVGSFGEFQNRIASFPIRKHSVVREVRRFDTVPIKNVLKGREPGNVRDSRSPGRVAACPIPFLFRVDGHGDTGRGGHIVGAQIRLGTRQS